MGLGTGLPMHLERSARRSGCRLETRSTRARRNRGLISRPMAKENS